MLSLSLRRRGVASKFLRFGWLPLAAVALLSTAGCSSATTSAQDGEAEPVQKTAAADASAGKKPAKDAAATAPTATSTPTAATATLAGDADSTPKAEPDAKAKEKPSEPGAVEEGRTNRLADETSPYLLQHARNPVDWYPWGEEALAKAKREKKVIFVSVGYSSCHWCHVMERESFEDKEIADILNKHFVCIKVDREERPDVDSIYMMAVQIISGRGGWPMSVFLTPEAKPFFGGTYFPARDNDRPGATGFLTLLQRVRELWTEQPDRLRKDAERLTGLIQQQLDGRPVPSLTPLQSSWLDDVQSRLAEQFDDEYGGFGFNVANPQSPKFPEPSNLLFLIDRVKRLEPDSKPAKEAREMLEFTLERMAMGGIRDHLGGGFHRYSVDRYWRIPHFEKMLYDNGQLASVYSEAYKLTGREDFRHVVEQMLEFVQREMTGPNGEFYSALDADSEGEEGKFYRWDREELAKLLAPEGFELLAATYGLSGEPNFEEEYFVPELSEPPAKIAEAAGLSVDELDARLTPMRKALLAVRSKRVRPLTDDKVLTSWNGLMIRGFADAGRILERPEYVEVAERAARFVLKNLRGENGRLLRTYGRGRARLNAYLNDYAFLVDGLLALHEATNKEEWLNEAEGLTKQQLELFRDEKNGGFYFTSDDHESLLSRIRDPFDGAQPSGNSVATQNLLYLSQARDSDEYAEEAEGAIRSVSGLLQSRPLGAPRMAVAVAEWLKQKPEQSSEKPEQSSEKPEQPASQPSP